MTTTRPPITAVFLPVQPQPSSKTVQVVCPVCGGTTGRDRRGNVKGHGEWRMGPTGPRQSDVACDGGGQKPERA